MICTEQLLNTKGFDEDFKALLLVHVRVVLLPPHESKSHNNFSISTPSNSDKEAVLEVGLFTISSDEEAHPYSNARRFAGGGRHG